MKTSIIDIPPKPDLKFPCLMCYRPTGHIVLFSSMEKGTVVHQANADWKVGYHSETWVRADNPEYWETFNGRLQLSN